MDAAHYKLLRALIALGAIGTGGGAGGFLFVRPLGGGQDDWPRLMGPGGICATAAATGVAVVMMPGLAGEHWLAQTDEQVPSNLVLFGTPQTIVDATLPDVGIGDAVFDMVGTQQPGFALAADNVPGATTFSVSGAPAGGWIVGSFVQLQTGGSRLHGSTYTIQAVTPAGPDFTLTVDRPVLYTALAATAFAVPVINVPQNIRIYGNGMTLRGSCAIFVELQGAVHCEVHDVILDGTSMPADSAGLIFDTYTLECKASGMRVNGASNIATGIEIIGEGHQVTECIASHCASENFAFGDCAVSSFSNLEGYASLVHGLTIGSDGGATGVPTDEGNTVSDCSFWGNGLAGIEMSSACGRWSFSNIISRYNNIGVQLQNLGVLGPPNSNLFTNLDASSNTGVGVSILAGVTQANFANVNVSGCPTGVNAVGGNASFTGLVAHGGVGAPVNASSNAHVSIVGFDIEVGFGTTGVQTFGTSYVSLGFGHFTMLALALAVSPEVTSRVKVSNVRITYNVVSEGITALGASVLEIDNVEVDGAGLAGSLGLNAASGCTMRIGPNVNFDACTGAPYNFIAGSHWSRSDIVGQPITLAGLTPQSVSFPDLAKPDDVMAWLSDPNGGTPSPVRVVKTPGVGFTLAGSVAGDTSKVNYTIV